MVHPFPKSTRSRDDSFHKWWRDIISIEVNFSNKILLEHGSTLLERLQNYIDAFVYTGDDCYNKNVIPEWFCILIEFAPLEMLLKLILDPKKIETMCELNNASAKSVDDKRFVYASGSGCLKTYPMDMLLPLRAVLIIRQLLNRMGLSAEFESWLGREALEHAVFWEIRISEAESLFEDPPK